MRLDDRVDHWTAIDLPAAQAYAQRQVSQLILEVGAWYCLPALALLRGELAYNTCWNMASKLLDDEREEKVKDARRTNVEHLKAGILYAACWATFDNPVGPGCAIWAIACVRERIISGTLTYPPHMGLAQLENDKCPI